MLAPNVLDKSDKAAANDSEVADMLPDANAEFVRNLSNSLALSLDIPKFLAKFVTLLSTLKKRLTNIAANPTNPPVLLISFFIPAKPALERFIPPVVCFCATADALAAFAASSKGPFKALKPGIFFTKLANPLKKLPDLSSSLDTFTSSFNLLTIISEDPTISL